VLREIWLLETHHSTALRGLERADSGDTNGLVELFARAVSESINRFILPRVAGDARLVPLSALAEGSPYSSDYLRQLALAGRLRAIRHGSLWLSSHAALKEYGRSPIPAVDGDQRAFRAPPRPIWFLR
jgi:hypothetical protein